MSDHPLLVTVLVRQLHEPRRFHVAEYPASYDLCAECRQVWPCKTEQVIAEALALPDVSSQPTKEQ